MPLYARKAMSIGDHLLAAGDLLTNEIMEVLPVGRLARLVAGGYVVERLENETLVTAAVEELFARVEVLEAQLSGLVDQTLERAARVKARPKGA